MQVGRAFASEGPAPGIAVLTAQGPATQGAGPFFAVVFYTELTFFIAYPCFFAVSSYAWPMFFHRFRAVGAIVLVFSALRRAVRYAAFRRAEGGLRPCVLPPFARQNAACRIFS